MSSPGSDRTVDREPVEREELRPWLARFGEMADGNGAGPELELVQEPDPSSSLVARRRGCTVVFDGVLHDASRLRRLLSGSRAPLETDADVVLEAYLRWGAELLDELKGIFALVVGDASQRSLLCARDPLGIYPLFYADGRSGLFVSTSIDALAGHHEVSGEVNRLALADHLLHRWPDVEETYYSAVRRVPPGHALTVDRAGRRTYPHWDPAPLGQEIEWLEQEEVERFDELLAQAVERCLRLGQTGIFLSGGLDSVTVAAVAVDSARACAIDDPQALSLVFPDPECNEEPVQRAVARELAIPQVVLGLDEAVGPDGLLLSALELSSRRSVPLMNYWTPGYARLGLEGRRRGCETILMGNGGDEWLNVTPVLAADLLRSGDLAGLWRLAGSHQRSFPVPGPRIWRSLLWTYGGRLLLKSAVASAAPWALRGYRRLKLDRSMPDWVAPESTLRSAVRQRVVKRDSGRLDGSHYLGELREALDHPLVAMEMEETFETGRAIGTRILSPFLDADLVDFLYRTPPALLNRAGREKGMVRDSLARRFPALGFEQHKKVSATSYARFVLTRQSERAWKVLGGVPTLAEMGVVDPDAFRLYFERAVSGLDREYWRIWDALSIEAWVQRRVGKGR